MIPKATHYFLYSFTYHLCDSQLKPQLKARGAALLLQEPQLLQLEQMMLYYFIHLLLILLLLMLIHLDVAPQLQHLRLGVQVHRSTLVAHQLDLKPLISQVGLLLLWQTLGSQAPFYHLLASDDRLRGRIIPRRPPSMAQLYHFRSQSRKIRFHPFN